MNDVSTYEKINDDNLSGRDWQVKERNGADNFRTASNRWEGNPDYKSSFNYQPTWTYADRGTINPKYLNAQVNEPNPVPINGGSEYEAYNTANLTNQKWRVLDQNGADDVRTASNRWQGNPEYKSSFDYKPTWTYADRATIHPKYLNAQLNEPTEAPRQIDQNGIDDDRTAANRWMGNHEYKSSYDYQPTWTLADSPTIKPKY